MDETSMEKLWKKNSEEKQKEMRQVRDEKELKKIIYL